MSIQFVVSTIYYSLERFNFYYYCNWLFDDFTIVEKNRFSSRALFLLGSLGSYIQFRNTWGKDIPCFLKLKFGIFIKLFCYCEASVIFFTLRKQFQTVYLVWSLRRIIAHEKRDMFLNSNLPRDHLEICLGHYRWKFLLCKQFCQATGKELSEIRDSE